MFVPNTGVVFNKKLSSAVGSLRSFKVPNGILVPFTAIGRVIQEEGLYLQLAAPRGVSFSCCYRHKVLLTAKTKISFLSVFETQNSINHFSVTLL